MKLRTLGPVYKNDLRFNTTCVLRCAVLYNRVNVLDVLDVLDELSGEQDQDNPWEWDSGLLALALQRTDPSSEVLERVYARLSQQDQRILKSKDVSYHTERGDLEVVRWLCEHTPSVVKQEAVDAAARRGYLELLAFFYERSKLRCRRSVLDETAKKGNIALLTYLYEHGERRCSKEVLDDLFRFDRIDMVKFVLANRKEEMRHFALLNAAQYGNFELIKFIFESAELPSPPGIDDTASAATEVEMSNSSSAPLLTGAARKAVATWKDFHDAFPDGCLAELIGNAAGYGNLEVVNYLDLIDASAPVATNTAGRSEFVPCARGDKCIARCKTRTFQMDMAAEGGHLDIVEFLHHSTSRGCTSAAMTDAAANGHVDVIEFLLRHRTEGDPESALRAAAVRPMRNVLGVLSPHCSDETIVLTITTARYYALETVQALYRNLENVSYAALKAAVARGPMEGSITRPNDYHEVIRFLFEKQSQNQRTHEYLSLLKQAVADSSSDVVKQVLVAVPEISTEELQDAMAFALEKGDCGDNVDMLADFTNQRARKRKADAMPMTFQGIY